MPGTAGRAWVDLVMAQELLIRRLQAFQIRTLAQVVASTPPARRRRRSSEADPALAPGEGDSAASISSQRLVSSRLAPELALHPHTASAEVAVAVGLVRHLPRIMLLVEQGRLDRARAALISRKLHQAARKLQGFGPDTDAWALIEAMLQAQAPDLAYWDLDRLIDRFLLGLEPDGGNAAHKQAMRSRHVRVEAQPDGMALVTALVSAGAGQLLDGFLDAAADAARDQAEAEGVPDGRTHDQRRADVLAALVQALAEGVDILLVPDPRHQARDDESIPFGEARSGSAGAGASESECPEPECPEPASNLQIPDAFRRRLESDLDAANVHRRETLTSIGFPPVPQGLIPTLWKMPELPRNRGQGPHLVITITDATLLGLDETPGLLQGHGAIPAVLARRLGVKPGQVTLMVLPGACTHDTYAAVTKPATGETALAGSGLTGAPSACPAGLDHDLPQARRYRPGRVLTSQITAGFPTCTFPNCTRPASKCDLDHLTPFNDGGLSCTCNMRPACRSHHRIKTFGGWQARPVRPGDPYPPGSTIWTTPDGTEYSTPPPCLPGMPGWTLPVVDPTPPAAERQSRVDLMSAAERSARRTRRWEGDLQWHADEQHRRREAAGRRAKLAAQAAAALRRPAQGGTGVPWGRASGTLPDHGDPAF